MGKADDIPESIPEMDPLDDKKEKAITELLESVKKQSGGEYPYIFVREETEEKRRLLAYKFLKARRWKNKDALDMITATVKFREENNIDEWKLFPSAFPLRGFDNDALETYVATIPGGTRTFPRDDLGSRWTACYRAMQQSYVNMYHYFDKMGHPILYDGFGHADVSGILRELEKITPVGQGLGDVIVPYHTYMNEVQYYLIRYAEYLNQVQRKAPGRSIMGITVILNAEGMHMGMIQKRFINVIKAIFDVDQKYYPEVLHRLFVINAPALLNMGYNLIKRSLDENTRKKVIICKKDESLDVLKRVIDVDKIPQELGGECRCPGGCLPAYRPATADGASSTGGDVLADDIPTENVTVAAGKTYERAFPLEAGDEVHWQFALEDTEILFQVGFETGAELADETSKKKSASKKDEPNVVNEKMSFGMDYYLATKQGVLRLAWNNGGSWMSSKRIQMRVWKANPTCAVSSVDFGTPRSC